MAKRNGPSDGTCAFCGEWEDCSHIFFSCHLAKFLWAGVRELLACTWNPAGVGDFLSIAQGLQGPLRRLAWFSFAALSWALWNIRNKLAIEGSLISDPADAMFKMSIYICSAGGFWSDGGTGSCWTRRLRRSGDSWRERGRGRARAFGSQAPDAICVVSLVVPCCAYLRLMFGPSVICHLELDSWVTCHMELVMFRYQLLR